MRRRSLGFWLAAVAVLAVVAYLFSRWALAQYYPLAYRQSLFLHAEQNGLNPYLVAALIRSESRFRPDAVSKQGARGLMQIMPETGQWIAGQMGVEFDPNRLDEPDYNIQLGCWYLANLRKEYAGDTVLALAAYNAGRGNVNKWLQERSWTGEHETVSQIPFAETRNYVSRVMRDLTIYQRLYSDTY